MTVFSFGDYVGGIKVCVDSIEKMIDLNCIISIKGKILAKRIRAVDKKTLRLIQPNNQPEFTNSIYSKTEIDFVAEIVWHRWKRK